MIPVKPFATYKWRWLSVQPSEGLLNTPVFLGVLRALSDNEGNTFTSKALQDSLRIVEHDTKSTVRLARDQERNLFRNSGQYWRGTGLLARTPGTISLTDLGRRVASGKVTPSEFAALVVQQTALPNPMTFTVLEQAKWRAAQLQISPLKLILEVVEQLGREHGGSAAAHINNFELVRILIPLAGSKTPVAAIAAHISLYRQGILDVSRWPDCAPEANDLRMANEFLLFLNNFDLLKSDATEATRDGKRYYLSEIFDVKNSFASTYTSIFDGEENSELAVDAIRHSLLPSIIERNRTITSSISRTGQSKFRSKIMNAYQGCCLITGEEIPSILEAAHIVPVTNNGSDDTDNGICMRIDIHRLYDTGNIRIRPDGSVVQSEALLKSKNYQNLPSTVTIPRFIKPANIAWRDRYL